MKGETTEEETREKKERVKNGRGYEKKGKKWEIMDEELAEEKERKGRRVEG